MLKPELGDARVWMELAEQLYISSTAHGARFDSGYPDRNRFNVAKVCAGYAFELVFRVLARAAGGEPEPRHEPSLAYECIEDLDNEDIFNSVNEILSCHGWADHEELMIFLDDLSDKDQKYWMRTTQGPRNPSYFSIGGRKGMDALRRLHNDLSQLAYAKINSSTEWLEVW